jgi:DNA repair protein RadD
MSATVFRTGHGMIYEGSKRLFNKLSYDLTKTDKFNELVDQGYLSNLISVETKMQLDSSGVKKSAGDYNIKALAKEHDKDEITRAAVIESLHYGKNYKKWLVFAIDIEHCEHICDHLNANGISARVLHSRMDADRDATLRDYKAGKFRALVSVGMVTTGFDVKDIDLILMLRPTESAVLWVQMAGRGLRIFPGKDHCLLLDYAGNTARLGPINNVLLPKKRGKGGGGQAPTKTCPVCSTITYTLAKHCDSCGHEFVFETKLQLTADTADVIERDGAPDAKIKWVNVKRVSYSIHEKRGAPHSLLVTYDCGLTKVREWVCVQHAGFAGHKARHWLKFRNYNGPMQTHAVLKRSSKLKQPKQLQVDFGPKYPNILNSRFD